MHLRAEILGLDFKVESLTGHDSISKGYEFEVTLSTNLDFTSIPLGQIIKTLYSGRIYYWSSVHIDERKNYYYKCKFYSPLQYSCKFKQYSIFHNQKVQEIISYALSKSDISFSYLAMSNKTYPYLVQYSETNHKFIDYITSSNNIFYYFQGTKLIFADRIESMELIADLRYVPHPNLANENVAQIITAWQLEAESINDLISYGFDPQNPQIKIHSSNINADPADHSYYSSISSPEDCDQISASFEKKDNLRYLARTYNQKLRAGMRINLTNHPDAGEYYIISIKHKYGDGYSNECILMKSDSVFIAPIPNMNKIYGLETATVVGPENQQIYNNQCAVKVRFHWDHINDFEHSSAYIPVLQPIAGKGYGSFILPRVGQRVAVGFENGDPSKPFVQGAFYDGENASYQTNNAISSLRVRSFNSDDFHEISISNDSQDPKITITSYGSLDENIQESRNITLAQGNLSFELKNGDCQISLNGDASQMKINAHGTNIIVNKDGVSIVAPSATVTGQQINLHGENLQITSNTIDIKSDTLSISTGYTSINATTGADIKSPGPINIIGIPVIIPK